MDETLINEVFICLSESSAAEIPAADVWRAVMEASRLDPTMTKILVALTRKNQCQKEA